jgi:hypothetical protein
MREIPILFSTPMVKTILDGSKTMTRRIFKGETYGDFDCLCKISKGLPKNQLNKWGAMFVDNCRDFPVRYFTPSPYGFMDDILWVRETWRVWLNDEGPEGYTRLIRLMADDCLIPVPEKDFDWFDKKEDNGYLNRPSI